MTKLIVELFGSTEQILRRDIEADDYKSMYESAGGHIITFYRKTTDERPGEVVARMWCSGQHTAIISSAP